MSKKKHTSHTSHSKKETNYQSKSKVKNIIFASVFSLLWLMSIFAETESTAGYYMYRVFINLFWEHYQFIFSPIALAVGLFLFFKENFSFNSWRFLWMILYFLWVTTLIWAFDESYKSFFNFYKVLSWFLWATTSTIFSFILILSSLYLIFKINYKALLKKAVSYTPNISDIKDSIWSIKWKDDHHEDEHEEEHHIPKKVSKELEKEKKEIEKMKQELEKQMQKMERQKEFEKESKSKNQLELQDAPIKIKVEKKDSFFSKIKENFSNDEENEDDYEEDKKVNINYDKWVLPNIDLLRDIGWNIEFNEKDIFLKQEEIVDKLAQFKIDVTMTWYRVWPTVIQFRLKPDEWVKLNKIENLKKDLTLALHAKSIRIQAPIPWEWVVWIEVPNENRQAVWLKEVIANTKFKNPKFEIPLAVWKDVNGDVVVWDLTKMPHLLVAWQTASWKSVWINWFIISMLYKFSPSELKMIMVDPKMVELSIYNWIPHLLTPVITNPDKALNSLKWWVAEMLRRYDLAKNVNARNFKEFNAKVKKEERLPYIVIIIDELADLMMSWNKKEVEGSIARLAQMARAVWMHLIIATQRPSVDVITWLIKANIPSRIAFTVASQIDSRTVIDKAWAEDLLGRWDMLYAPTWVLEPERVQWVLVETDEVEAIVNELKLTIDPDMINNLYDDSIVNGKSNTAWSILENYNWDQEEDSEIIEKAIAIVRESKKWSTSLIQRKLWLWYARAAKVLDILEELWVVWPSNGSKPRDVYE